MMMDHSAGGGGGSESALPYDVRFLTPKELAGEHFDEMLASKDATMRFLLAPSNRTRLGAILICEQNWRASSEHSVLEACRSLAGSDADDSIRMVACDVIGRALSATKDPETTKFVARIVLDPHNSATLRTHAYWVLREIVYGVADVDFDNFMRGTIHTVKTCLNARPQQLSEESVKSALVPDGCFQDNFWESSDRIDWDFVCRLLRE